MLAHICTGNDLCKCSISCICKDVAICNGFNFEFQSTLVTINDPVPVVMENNERRERRRHYFTRVNTPWNLINCL